MRELGIETIEVVEIHRSQINPAPYNPRTMSDRGRRRLGSSLGKHGLVDLLIWNRRTGFLVGGHQRLADIDKRVRKETGGLDYTLHVQAGDWDEAQEREINIALNNPEAQGEYQLDALERLFRDPVVKIDVAGTGFDSGDLYRVFGSAPFEDRPEELQALGDKVREFGERFSGEHKVAEDKHSTRFYMVLVFRDQAHRDAVGAAMQLDGNRYQSAADLWPELAPDA